MTTNNYNVQNQIETIDWLNANKLDLKMTNFFF